MTSNTEGTTVITLANGDKVAIADWVDDRLYGSAQLSHGQTGIVEAFSNGPSQAIPGGARAQLSADTNVPRNGDSGLPAGHEMLIYGIGIRFVRAVCPPTGAAQPVQADGNGALSDFVTARTMFAIDRVTHFSFTRAGKAYASGTPLNFPPGSGLSGLATSSNLEVINNGVADPRGRAALVLPIHLKPNEAFKGIFNPGSALHIQQAPPSGSVNLSFVDVKVELYGLVKRPVQ